MTECLGESDVTELANSTLAEFDQEIATLAPELCVPFNQAAMRLEGELLTIYEFAKRLHDLSVSHPACGAGFFYDRVLDLRNKCQRLQEMHS